MGAVYKNPSSKWASPALEVPKPGSSKMRFTVDLRGPNAQTVPIQPSMPHLESMLQSTAGSLCFAQIDMAHAYWQLLLAKDSQEMLSIKTPLRVFFIYSSISRKHRRRQPLSSRDTRCSPWSSH